MRYKMRSLIAIATLFGLIVAVPGLSSARQATGSSPRAERRSEGAFRKFTPAVATAHRLSRYFVVMKAPSVAQRVISARHAGAPLASAAQGQAKRDALAAQSGALAQARSAGGQIVFRYGTLVNAFSAVLSQTAAEAISRRSDVSSVQPVSIVVLDNSTSVPFIGAPKVWNRFGARGQGMTLALVDTGIDYTHKDFGGPGTVAAYEKNDPNVVEPGTFPTKKVIGGYDFVGSNYSVVDDDPSNDIPRPDFDPLDRDGHGTHTGGTCCGIGVPGKVGAGVAPEVKIRAYKVWDVGNSTDDVLVAAYERAVDPNQDGDTSDQADVLSFSGGVDYGTLNSVEAVAAQRVVSLGTVFVASAGNSGNQTVGASNYIVGTPATARGVISVAASIDQFVAQTMTIVDPPTDLADNGLMVFQDWSTAFDTDITDLAIDAREFDPPSDPSGQPQASDAMLCGSTPPGDFGGHIALVFKGATGDGDCTGSEKVFRAQEMGASAVILWNGFGGIPFGLGPGDFVDQIDIPAVMLSTNDSETLADTISPDAANGNFNTVDVTVTLHADATAIPGFEDSMTDFTSGGPARLTNDLKPDISAPGSDITSAGVGTGDDGAVLSGTSMAAPHVSGTAVLMRQLHPTWSPGQIKALLMNQAKRNLKNNDLSSPVPATVAGAGRVQAFEASLAKSLASPGSLSFGLNFVAVDHPITRWFRVRNFDSVGHDYDVSTVEVYSDYPSGLVTRSISLGGSYSGTKSFHLAPGRSQRVWVRVTLHPDAVPEALQEFGWYYFNGNVDGSVNVQQNGPSRDLMRVAWHVTPLAASNDHLSKTSLDLTGPPQTMTLVKGGAGTSHADLYLLGATDPVGSTGEEDIVAIGARSFTGGSINGVPKGLPTGTDPLVGISWIDFLTNSDVPTEPVEFVVQGAGVRNTTETLEIDVKVDVGADGVFADPDLQADFLVVKPPGSGGATVVFDLSEPDPFDNPVAVYFADYSVYNTNLTGLPVDAQALGLSNGTPTLSYQVTSCTGRFSGDVPGQFCDTAGDFDPDTGTYTAVLNATDPALDISPLVCGGFWGGGKCNPANPIVVSAGSALPDDNPGILAVFPNNAPARTPTVVETQT
jgi:subtilisin family serine protease